MRQPLWTAFNVLAGAGLLLLIAIVMGAIVLDILS